MAELDPNTLARVLTRLHHSARGTGEGEDWYQVPVSLMNVALAALQRIPELERQAANLESDLHSQDADYWRQRAERVEATLRDVDAWLPRAAAFVNAVIVMADDRSKGLALLADMALWNDRRRAALSGAPTAVPRPCPTCDGCGQVADTENQEPWTAWTNLPVGSAAAVLAGLVKPIPCPACGAPVEEGR